MTGFTHILVASTLFTTTNNKPVGLVLAFASHFVLDSIPHFELTKKVNYILAIIAGFILLASALFSMDAYPLLAGFLGAFPDLNTLFLKNKSLNKIHRRAHYRRRVYSSWVSLGFELTLSTACIFLLFWR